MAVWASRLRIFADVDAQLHDRITRLLPAPAQESAVVLVDIDEASLAAIGPWPWPRTVVADLVTRLRASEVQLQVWDLFFPEPAPGDEVFGAAIQAGAAAGAGDVVLGQVLVLDPQVQAPPKLGRLRPSASAPAQCSSAHAATGYLGVADSLPELAVGHLSSTPDRDGALRRLPAVICVGQERYPQLTMAAAERLEPKMDWVEREGSTLWGPSQWAVRGGLAFALDEHKNLVVPYRRAHGQWPAVSALSVLEGSAGATQALKGKVVLVGATALGLADTVSTPFHPKAPGVSVHAELMSAALSGRWVVAPGSRLMASMVLLLSLGAALLALHPWLQRSMALAAAGLAAASMPLALAAGARAFDLILPVALPTAALMVLTLALIVRQVDTARRQARMLASHLESFLPRRLAQEIARQNPSSESLGRPQTGVILAMRVVGLERWCTHFGSFKGLGLVHAITSLADSHARQHGGHLQHLLGDTLLLAWPWAEESPRPAPAGSAQEQPEALLDAVQAHGAVRSAIAASKGLMAELGSVLRDAEAEHQPLGLRVAIETGPYLLAVAGSSSSRRSLVLGPAVDMALGLLPLCDELASPVLLGEAAGSSQSPQTVQGMGQFLLPDAGQPRSVFRPLT
jgi:adenylate cyclase